MARTNHSRSHTGCSRRVFFGNCARLAGVSAAFSMLVGQNSLVESAVAAVDSRKTRIRVVFAHPDPTRPNWPNIGYDFKGRIEELTRMLRQSLPGIEFSTVTVSDGSEREALRVLGMDDDVDGYVIWHVGCLWGDLTERISAAGKPTVMVDELYAGSGEFLTSYARARRRGDKVIAVSSSRFEDAVEAVRCVDAVKWLSRSTALVVGRDPDPVVSMAYGTNMRKVEFDEINEAYSAVNGKAATRQADIWIDRAERVVEPSREDVEKAAAMYLAMVSLMEKHSAAAITINCLGGIYAGRMVEAYPCLGFMQLDDDGMVGACEADQRSTITKLLMGRLTGRPGFISDPVVDTATNRIIYAHCVGPTKVHGPDKPANPYHLRSHSEDRKGACNRSLMPLGEMTTTIMFDHHKRQVIMHQGTTVENVDDDKACRTKLAVEVKGDVYKLLNYWDQWSWHRVTFYGDLKRSVYDLAAVTGFEVVEEA